MGRVVAADQGVADGDVDLGHLTVEQPVYGLHVQLGRFLGVAREIAVIPPPWTAKAASSA